MKRVKNYIETDLAKKKIARYKYWSIKDENGITIISSDDDAEGQSFSDHLNKIIGDNVDAEVQVKYGTNEQSSRQNPPFFIKVNESIEWIEPEQDDMVQINGVAHKVDKNGNVNIQLTTPEQERPTVEAVPIDAYRQEFDLQLQGMRNEYELRDEKTKQDTINQLAAQEIRFKEMMLSERESRIAEREQQLAIQEAELNEKQKEIQEDVKGYAKQIPSALGGLIKDWVKDGAKKKEGGLAGADKKKDKPPRKRKKVNFSITPEEAHYDKLNVQEEEFEEFEELEEEIETGDEREAAQESDETNKENQDDI